jgi:hypothetical protein
VPLHDLERDCSHVSDDLRIANTRRELDLLREEAEHFNYSWCPQAPLPVRLWLLHLLTTSLLLLRELKLCS